MQDAPHTLDGQLAKIPYDVALPGTGSFPVVSENAVNRTGCRPPHRRRRFTPRERQEVARVRKIGACERCHIRRVKCQHARAQVGSSSTSDFSRSIVSSSISDAGPPAPNPDSNSSCYEQEAPAIHTQSRQGHHQEHDVPLCPEDPADLRQNSIPDLMNPSLLPGQQMEAPMLGLQPSGEGWHAHFIDSIDDMVQSVATPMDRMNRLEVTSGRWVDIVEYPSFPTDQQSLSETTAPGSHPTRSDAEFTAPDRRTNIKLQVTMQPTSTMPEHLLTGMNIASSTAHAFNGQQSQLYTSAQTSSTRTDMFNGDSFQTHNQPDGRSLAGDENGSEATMTGSRTFIIDRSQTPTQGAFLTEDYPITPWSYDQNFTLDETGFGSQPHLSSRPFFETPSSRPIRSGHYVMPQSQQGLPAIPEQHGPCSLANIDNRPDGTGAPQTTFLYSNGPLSDQAPVSLIGEVVSHAVGIDADQIPSCATYIGSDGLLHADYSFADFQAQPDGLDELVFSSADEEWLPSLTAGSSQPQKLDTMSTSWEQTGSDAFLEQSIMPKPSELEHYADADYDFVPENPSQWPESA